MADITYYVDDYIEQGYYVYTADAVIGLGDYLVEDYLADGYYQRTGIYFSLTAELVRATYIEGAATLASAFTQSTDIIRLRGFDVAMISASTMTTSVEKFVGVASALTNSCSIDVTAGVDRRTSVTLSTLADLNSQAARTRDLASALTATVTQSTSATKTTNILLDLAVESTQTTTALRTAPAAADLTATATQSTQAVKTVTVTPAFDSIASQLTVAYKNATGTILMEPRATLTAVIGVIKQFEPNTITGVASPDISLTDPYITTTWTNLVISIWTARTGVDSLGQAPIWSTPIITSAGGSPAYIRRLEYNNTSEIRFVSVITGTPIYWAWNSSFPNDTEWHNIVLVYRGPGNDNYKKFELFVDGVSKGIAQAYYSSDQTFWTNALDEGYTHGLRLGRTVYGNGESDQGAGNYQGDFAQLWVGKDPNFSIVDFYDQGIVDLGPDGTAYGALPLPLIYNELDSLEDTYYQIPASTPLSRPSLIGRFGLSAQSVSVLENTVYAEASFTLSATATRLQTASADLVSTATASIAAVKTSVGEAAFTNTISLSTDYIRYRDVGSTLNSESTQTTDNVRLRYFDSLLNSIATLTAAINETTELAADLTATATLDTVYTRVRYQASSLTAQASLAFDPEDRLRDQSAALSAQATLTADAINLEGTRVTFAVTATLICDAEKRIVSGANLTAQFTQISTAFKVVFAQANLPVVASQLSVIDIINFDPFLIFVVPAETRSIRVRPESREFIVEQESREIRVKSETREYLVPQSKNEKLTQGSPL